MTLTIISHTEHYQLPDGRIVGFGSTVTEINQLLAVFESITHVAMLHATPPPANALPYHSERIRFVALPAVGGTNLSSKLKVLFVAPKVLNVIGTALRGADYFQFRAPTGIGVYVIPYLLFFSNKKGWFKYAGNWKQEQAPLAYRFQKWLLEMQHRPVTINGRWADQPSHCLSFENPCLTNEEFEAGQTMLTNKSYDGLLNFCFVGRLEPAKGLDLLFEALALLDVASKKRIGTFHVVGEGQQIYHYKRKASQLDLNVVFHGWVGRTEVHDIYKMCHAIILPSASEGFPKVIAEAMNYGCLPIVSNVSSIGQYVQDGVNGFLLKAVDVSSLMWCMATFLGQSHEHLTDLSRQAMASTKKFTYEHYHSRLMASILKNN